MATQRYITGTTTKDPRHKPPGVDHIPQPNKKQHRLDVAAGLVKPNSRQRWVNANFDLYWLPSDMVWEKLPV